MSRLVVDHSNRVYILPTEPDNKSLYYIIHDSILQSVQYSYLLLVLKILKFPPKPSTTHPITGPSCCDYFLCMGFRMRSMSQCIGA